MGTMITIRLVLGYIMGTESLFLAMTVTFTASCLQGIAGFGAGLISMGALASIWSVPFATAVMLPLGVILNLSLMIQRHQTVELTSLRWVFIGLPVGVILGLFLLESVSESFLKQLLGLALGISAVNTMMPNHLQRKYGRFPALITGTCAGISGTTLSASGPPILIYANLLGWNRDLYRAQLSVLFLTCSSLALIALSVRGQVNLTTLSLSLSLTPTVLIGSIVGATLGSWLPQRVFRLFVQCLLILLSARFILRS